MTLTTIIISVYALGSVLNFAYTMYDASKRDNPIELPQRIFVSAFFSIVWPLTILLVWDDIKTGRR